MILPRNANQSWACAMAKDLIITHLGIKIIKIDIFSNFAAQIACNLDSHLLKQVLDCQNSNLDNQGQNH
jgi:hypothetical protein